MDDGFVGVGSVNDYIAGSVPVDITELIRSRAPNAIPRILVRFADSLAGVPSFSAVASLCTHRGCPVLTGDGSWGTTDQPIYDATTHIVTCPCHNSQFDVSNGSVIRGPAKFPLAQFKIDIRDSDVFVAVDPDPTVLPLLNIDSLGNAFPGTGNRYLVDFSAFLVELFFESETSLTYTGIRRDGSRGASETVTIESTYLRDNLFMVTWQEADRTTVVHVEDFEQSIIYTNITNPDQSFMKFRGSFKRIF